MYAAGKIMNPSPVLKNTVQLIRGGKPYFDLLIRLINEARESVHLQTYIFDDDETGRDVGEALKAAARRNVSVHLLADGYASQVMSAKYISELREAGVHVRFFEPLLKSKYFYFGRRMHHKVFVADTRYCLVGGINITNRYNDLPGKPAWLDFALYAEGEIARQLCILCWKTWNGFPSKMGKTPCEEKPEGFQQRIKMRRNDWVRRKNEISESYIGILRQAKSHITILSSYFLPGKIIRSLLEKSASRGVKIRIITAGPSDVMVAKYAERWLYAWLLRNNIELYEYQPAVLHAKVAVCDSKWFTIGSYNVNNISAYTSIELNLDVFEPVLAAQTEEIINEIVLKDCKSITPDKIARKVTVFTRLTQWLSYQLIRMIFYMLTFYYKRKS
ncbi:MAG: phospholipase [Chitinophagaceae bacterium]|nr:phospholipase [Chitinophagaceae bacterium]